MNSVAEDMDGAAPGASSSYGAAPFSHSAAATAPTSTIATAMLFGTMTFACASLAARTWLTGDARAIRSAFHPKSSPLDVRSFASVYTLLHHSTVMGMILLFAYVCEYHPPFPHSQKSYDRDEFIFLVLLLFIASAYTVHKNDGEVDTGARNGKKGGGGGGGVLENSNGNGPGHGAKSSSAGRSSSRRSDRSSSSSVAEAKDCNDVLNRDQTEEWKGWMQFIFLMYHYYHADEVYNTIRIMITCYVWMTGFGNFSFFYLKGDYSVIRVIQMLWRLNFLVLFLCLSQGTTYILYYICPLHTYFFLMVYATMRVGKHLNYTKYGIRFKLACVALLIFFLWDVDSGLFQMVHFPFLGAEPIVGATAGSMWEWYFRTTLDHWSTFLGMIFALNYPITSLFFRKLESRPWQQEWLGKGAVGAALLAAFYVWVTGPFMRSKIEYNATNSYFGFIPLIAYIYLRNLTPTLRSYSLDLLHQIGKTTLETYLMQHHIWLTSDAKSLLTLIPGWPKANMLVVTMIYFYVSRRLYRLTLFLRGMLLPDKSLSDCLRSLGAMAAAVSAFYGFALGLAALGLTSLTAVAIVSASCGMLLYQTVMDATWREYRESAPSSSRSSDEDDRSLVGSVMKAGAAVRAHAAEKDSPVARLSPPVIGAMVVLVVGLTWHGMAETGAGKIGPLHAECEAFANDGVWVPLDGCDETSRGAAYRDDGVSAFATCGSASGAGAARVWGWNDTAPYTHCRFRRRDVRSAKKALKRRSVVFVGDSMTRNLYYAQLRALGVADAGRFDATLPKHSDVFNTVGSASVDFRWAPLAVDQLAALRDINSKTGGGEAAPPGEGAGAGAGDAPDLLVVGGGAWDRLHVFATDEDQKSHRQTVRELAQEMRKARVAGAPVAWVVPTTINTPALNTEDKRDHMREEDMEEMRGAYAAAGVLSASSFVLDGPAFTADRVAESYDGVHYPPHVYDAGAQILANAMDWLLPERVDDELFVPPTPGKMANPFLGLMMLCFVFIGLMFFDGFMGFSYLASLFVRGVMPNDLYEEAFTALHRKMKLPSSRKGGGNGAAGGSGSVASAASGAGGSTSGGGDLSRRSSGGRSGSITPSRRAAARNEDSPAGAGDASSTVDEEIVALLGSTGADLELGARK